MGSLLEVKDKVLRYLTDFVGDVKVGADGSYSFEFGSTVLRLTVHEDSDEEYCIAHVSAPIAFEVPASPALFKWVALRTGDFLFGHIECIVENDDDPEILLIFSHTLLADYLDPEELRRAVGAVVSTADNLDDEVVQQFGGKTYEDL